MRIALLCPGPSLPEFWPGTWTETADDEKRAWYISTFDLVVAVNTAAWLYPCDWLAVADLPILEDPRCIRPRVGYITHEAMSAYLPVAAGHAFLPLRLSMGITCKYPLPPEKPTDACAFTFPNALEWCRRALQASGHTEVCLDLFGFDCSPSAVDCAGREGQHHLERWRWELPWIKHAWFPGIRIHSRLPVAVSAWLNDRGSWEDCEASLGSVSPREETKSEGLDARISKPADLDADAEGSFHRTELYDRIWQAKLLSRKNNHG